MKITVTNGIGREVNELIYSSIVPVNQYSNILTEKINPEWEKFEETIKSYPALNAEGKSVLDGEYNAELVWQYREFIVMIDTWTAWQNSDESCLNFRKDLFETRQIYLIPSTAVQEKEENKTMIADPIDRAADAHGNSFFNETDEVNSIIYNAFKAGAKWQKSQQKDIDVALIAPAHSEKESQSEGEFKGTKGEWTIKRMPRNIESAMYSSSIQNKEDSLHIDIYTHDATLEEAVANTYLISAAPDLLKALIKLTDKINEFNIEWLVPEYEIACDAINKALATQTSPTK